MPSRGSTAASLVGAKLAPNLLSMRSIALCFHALQPFRLLMTTLSLLVCLEDGEVTRQVIGLIRKGLLILVDAVKGLKGLHSVVVWGVPKGFRRW